MIARPNSGLTTQSPAALIFLLSIQQLEISKKLGNGESCLSNYKNHKYLKIDMKLDGFPKVPTSLMIDSVGNLPKMEDASLIDTVL